MKPFTCSVMAGVAALTAVSSVAQADIFMSTGNIGTGLTENILFQIDQPTGLTQTGVTNQTGFLVTFLGTEELDVAGSQGQARIEAVDGGLNSLCVTVEDPDAGYRRLIMNLFNPAFTTGQVFFTVTEWDGTVNNFQFALDGNGSNFFTVWAENGQIIREVCFTTDADLIDVRQVRMGGAHVIPGPAAIIPFAVGLVAAFRRRRQ